MQLTKVAHEIIKMKEDKGLLYWITGLSGAGKTTIGRELYHMLKSAKPNVIFLDGDMLRDIFKMRGENAYTEEQRRKIAKQYCRLCKMLTAQNIDVVCATISMFEECHRWNRDNIARYREIYIRVPMEILKNRNSKKIYESDPDKKNGHVVGVDIPFDEPKSPDMTVENDGTETPKNIAQRIYEHFNQ